MIKITERISITWKPKYWGFKDIFVKDKKVASQYLFIIIFKKIDKEKS